MDRPPQPTRLGPSEVTVNRAEVLAELGYCGFVEDVSDASMCVCGLPALNHAETVEGLFRVDLPYVAAALDAALAAQEGERGGTEVAAAARLASLATLVDVATRNYGDGPLNDPYHKGIAFAVSEVRAALDDPAGAFATHDAEVLRAAADDIDEECTHWAGSCFCGSTDKLRERADRIEAQS